MTPARENPFRSERVEALAFRFDGDDAGYLLARLHALGGRGLLLGPEGSGKTTLLEALARHLAAAEPVVWLRLRRDPQENRARLTVFLATPLMGRTVCVDGLEQLGWWHWHLVRRHARKAARLIATSHRLGRLPLLRRHGTSPQLLADLVRELAGGQMIDPAALWHRHAGNLRLCLRTLYDQRAAD